MSETIQLTTLNDDLTDALPISVFQLEKPPKSIFVGLECREFPDFPVIYGFIANKMGIKLRKKKLEKYGDEQTHYKKYLKQVKWLEELQYISVEYSHSKHGYARIQALNSLSLALFRRVSRHAFCKGKYIDCDLVNCHLQFFKEYGKLFGFTDEEMEGLIEYCRDPKYWRAEIVRHYGLKDRTEDDGSITLAKDQAKELCIRLAFGGSLRAWKFENQVARGQDLPIVAKLESSLELIRDEIWNANPQMIQNLEENDEDFSAKSSEDKKKSLMAIWSQTKERLIQEECVAYLVKNFPSVQLRDVISSQDGMMVLKEQMEGVDIPLLFQRFNEIIKRKFNIQMTWVVKEFDEALSVPRCSTMPIDITLDDLEKGERHIAELIAPAFKSTFKYFNVDKEKYWYILTKNIWVKTTTPDKYRIVRVLQSYIDEEKQRVWNAWKEEKDEDKKKELGKNETQVKKHYEKVGKGNYASQLIKYLGSLLKDNDFPEKLDNTKGLFVFKDCLLDLKTGETRAIVPEDYITFVNDIEYLKLPPPNKEKMDFILSNLKKTFNNNQEHLEYGLSAIGYSLTGDAGLEKAIYCFKDGTDAEKGNNGKSLPFKLLKGIFPKIVDDTPYKVFEEKFNNAHKFIKDWRHLRLLYCDEGSKNKVDAELVKLVGAGEPIKNQVMFGYKETIIPQFKFFLCSNVLFNVGKDADAVFNRYKEMPFNSHFDIDRLEDNYETLEFRADKNLPDTMLTEYKDELIHLFIGYALKYYKNGGMPPLPAEFAKATALTKMKNNDFAVWFWNNFEIGEGNISIDTLLSCSTKITDRKTMFAELKKIEIKADKDLFGLGKKKNEKGEDVYIKGGIVGFVRKENED
jgi:phage/plasmid-associated DNA primase